MKTSDLQKRLRQDRHIIEVTLRMPENVVEDLKRVAPFWGFSGHVPLMRSYIGQGLRLDLAKLEATPKLTHFVENRRQYGVDEAIIAQAISKAS
jgi:hypothetical protein